MLEKLKKEVYEANIDLVKKGLVMQNFGNVSGIERESGIVCIRPTGIPFDKLTPENMILVDLKGNKVEGELNPSSDTKTHLILYNEFKEIGGVVHTHSKYATVWAQANHPLLCLGTTHADYFRGEVPCTELIKYYNIKEDFEHETGKIIIDTFKHYDYREVKAVLVACHGPFCWGRDPEEAVYINSVLEDIAEINFYSILINKDLKNIKSTLIDKHYLRRHGGKG